MPELTPKQIVSELNRYIVGQDDAKRAVAVALRNRYRRMRLSDDLRDEVSPKNILMVGPTGVGKTEIARRLAKLVDAPFIKVEATKFTEVGYVGRDVDSIVRDLVEAAMRIVKTRMLDEVSAMAEEAAAERIVDALCTRGKPREKQNPLDMLLGVQRKQDGGDPAKTADDTRIVLRCSLDAGELEGELIEIEVEENPPMEKLPGMEINIGDLMGGILPKQKKWRKVSVAEARRLLGAEEAQKLIDMDAATGEAIALAEQHGIVFIDEIDKVAGRSQTGSPDVSREGVQRDILPIVEGSTVSTKYGPVSTQHMLFIAAGAFHVAKVSDLIPELQGRFPIRVDLLPLTRSDFLNILTQPENALIKQYQALLAIDAVNLSIAPDALEEIATFAVMENERGEDIGARRLSSVIEKLVEDISFEADGSEWRDVIFNASDVKAKLGGGADRDIGRFII